VAFITGTKAKPRVTVNGRDSGGDVKAWSNRGRERISGGAGSIYSPREREPYDALSDRFLRAFESSLEVFRTWERVREANASETFRDLLLRMEKVGLIGDLATWIGLRDLRNRVVHDYLPDELAALYAAIIEDAVPEFRRLEAASAERLR
jgi:hypothetical protein